MNTVKVTDSMHSLYLKYMVISSFSTAKFQIASMQ
jgi:hypothetical protein